MQSEDHVKTKEKTVICKPRKERLQNEISASRTLIWTSNLQNREKVNFCCLSHLVCDTLLWQDQKTNKLLYEYLG